MEAVIYQGHQLVVRGPFRFVRHPMYTGFSLMFVGMGLAVQSLAAVVFGHRITIEEKALISEFDEEYVSYSRRVKRRVIPFIL